MGTAAVAKGDAGGRDRGNFMPWEPPRYKMTNIEEEEQFYLKMRKVKRELPLVFKTMKTTQHYSSRDETVLSTKKPRKWSINIELLFKNSTTISKKDATRIFVSNRDFRGVGTFEESGLSKNR
uniref:Uncharacterized protein n=1 Tax=Romanomermis culicivorax TaxID=13658 RepID=A0A915J237_ROMCU